MVLITGLTRRVWLSVLNLPFNWCSSTPPGELWWFFFLIFWPHQAACGIFVPWPGIELVPLHWQHGVLTTGPPGKSWTLVGLCGPLRHLSWGSEPHSCTITPHVAGCGASHLPVSDGVPLPRGKQWQHTLAGELPPACSAEDPSFKSQVAALHVSHHMGGAPSCPWSMPAVQRGGRK